MSITEIFLFIVSNQSMVGRKISTEENALRITATENPSGSGLSSIDNSTTNSSKQKIAGVDASIIVDGMTLTRSSNEITDVTVMYDNAQPLSYIIKDAYPNPFNPVTNITVELNTAADISVQVYNLTGQLVDVIAQGNFSPNTYNWTWNAENLASGVYFIATQIGNDINNQKVMLIK